jgi:hypothetical protein
MFRPNQSSSTPYQYSGREEESVDDIIVASKAAELELMAMKRYFTTGGIRSGQGIDGLADEDLSSSSDEEDVAPAQTPSKSSLDALLAKNSLVAMDDAGSDLGEDECGLQSLPEESLEAIPKTMVVPYGSKNMSLGFVQSIVDGFLVIGHKPLAFPEDEENSSTAIVTSEYVACDVESMVFLAGSDPLEVLGLIVDTLGSTKNPMHLVLVTNKPLVAQLTASSTLIGSKVCTIDSHCRVVEVNELNGSTYLNGVPQLADEDQFDDDGADYDEDCIEDQPRPQPTRQPPPVQRAHYQTPQQQQYHPQRRPHFMPSQPAQAPQHPYNRFYSK